MCKRQCGKTEEEMKECEHYLLDPECCNDIAEDCGCGDSDAGCACSDEGHSKSECCQTEGSESQCCETKNMGSHCCRTHHKDKAQPEKKKGCCDH